MAIAKVTVRDRQVTVQPRAEFHRGVSERTPNSPNADSWTTAERSCKAQPDTLIRSPSPYYFYWNHLAPICFPSESQLNTSSFLRTSSGGRPKREHLRSLRWSRHGWTGGRTGGPRGAHPDGRALASARADDQPDLQWAESVRQEDAFSAGHRSGSPFRFMLPRSSKDCCLLAFQICVSHGLLRGIWPPAGGSTERIAMRVLA